MQTNERRLSVWYVLFLLSAFLLVRSVLFAPHQETLSYSEFKAPLRRGNIVEAVIDKQTVARQ